MRSTKLEARRHTSKMSEAMKMAVRETVPFVTQRLPKLSRDVAAGNSVDLHQKA